MFSSWWFGGSKLITSVLEKSFNFEIAFQIFQAILSFVSRCKLYCYEHVRLNLLSRVEPITMITVAITASLSRKYINWSEAAAAKQILVCVSSPPNSTVFTNKMESSMDSY